MPLQSLSTPSNTSVPPGPARALECRCSRQHTRSSGAPGTQTRGMGPRCPSPSSSRVSGRNLHAPDDGMQPSSVHGSPSSQTTAGDATHAPFTQWMGSAGVARRAVSLAETHRDRARPRAVLRRSGGRFPERGAPQPCSRSAVRASRTRRTRGRHELRVCGLADIAALATPFAMLTSLSRTRRSRRRREAHR